MEQPHTVFIPFLLAGLLQWGACGEQLYDPQVIQRRSRKNPPSLQGVLASTHRALQLPRALWFINLS